MAISAIISPRAAETGRGVIAGIAATVGSPVGSLMGSWGILGTSTVIASSVTTA